MGAKVGVSKAIVVGALGAGVLAASAPAKAEDLRAQGRYFRDEAGAIVMLRGLNVAGDAKVPPFRPVDDPALFDPFPDWGVNVARLLFTWEAFEPERGVYDESYFDYYVSLIDALEARGVWTIVDIHQDAFSRFTTDGCGEGMPAWAVSSAVTAKTPDNGEACAGWGLKMILNGDTHRCWDDFYADTEGVRSRYLTLMDILSTRLSPKQAVIGYDMLNEPWGDELKQIGPLYADTAKIIRAHDERAILFTSPQALTSAGQETKLERPSYDNFAYSPHFYDGAVIQLHTWLGGSLKEPVERMFNQALAWDVPLLLGEFGAPGEGNNVVAYMDTFYQELDARLISATQWSWVAHWDEVKKDGWNVEDFSIVDGEQTVRPTYRVRPYPARIAGEPLSFAVLRDPLPVVEFSYTHDPSLGATRLFAPQSVFESQVRAEVEGDASCRYESDIRHVRCTSDVAGDVHIRLVRCLPGEACLEVEEAPPAAPVDGGAAAPDAGPTGDGDGVAVSAPDGCVSSDAGGGTPRPGASIRQPESGCAIGGPRGRAGVALLGALLPLLLLLRRRRP